MRHRLLMAITALLAILPLALAPLDAPVLGAGGVSVYLPLVSRGLSAPVLKWQRGGCYSSWCETGWYSSPAVADIDNDGQAEVIGAAYSLFVLNGKTGQLKWSMALQGGRIWPGVVVADLDNDGKLEIVSAESGGYLNVVQDVNHAGKLLWSRRPTTSELRGLSVADLDNDGKLEIVVTAAIGSQTDTWVYDASGNLRAGWPQLQGNGGYAWGVYNDNAALGDIDGDGKKELVVPSDVHYINAYEANGALVKANALYGNKNWGQVGVWENASFEVTGGEQCASGLPRSKNYRANFADGPADILDVNGDGHNEVVATGNVYDCSKDPYQSRYTGVYLFNGDRTRFNAGGYDWSTAPVDTGAPISEDYNVIETAEANPVVADLDGDGKKEILYASYDGRLHAFWLDKTEHGQWPYSVYHPADGFYSFASEPVVADLDNDGKAEVIFTSWVQKGTQRSGKLYILGWNGSPISVTDLPPAFGDDWNGGLPAPTLADIDGDGELEIVVNSAHSGLLAYDLPGVRNARILWGTGRGSYLRNGAP